MQVGDLVRDINDDEYYIIIGKVDRGCEFKVFRVIDEHVDTRDKDELEVVCK